MLPTVKLTQKEIKKVLKLHQKWLSGERRGEKADLRGADLREADLRGAKLVEADLEGANLRRANLEEAILWEADLRGAYLWGANLKGADLRRANLTNVKSLPLPDLNILKNQKGKLRAFKLVNENYESISKGGIKYEIGKVVKEDNYDPDERVLCSRGINVATLEWCLKNGKIGYRLLEVEFTAKDIVAIPYATDGNFRVKRCKVIREIKEE